MRSGTLNIARLNALTARVCWHVHVMLNFEPAFALDYLTAMELRNERIVGSARKATLCS